MTADENVVMVCSVRPPWYSHLDTDVRRSGAARMCAENLLDIGIGEPSPALSALPCT